MRHAINRCVTETQIREIFSKALDYTYVFDLPQEDESLPTPQYSEFEYREEIMRNGLRKIELVCRQLNSMDM